MGKGPSIAMSCGVGQDVAWILHCYGCRLAAAAPIQPLAWELSMPPVQLSKAKKKKNLYTFNSN